MCGKFTAMFSWREVVDFARPLLVAAAMPLLSIAALADPYEAGQKQLQDRMHAAQERDFLAEVRRINFANRCHVFAYDFYARALVQERTLLLRNSLATDGRLVDERTLVAAKVAAQAGWDEGGRSCAYWQNHPEEVYELRRRGQSALDALGSSPQ
jgi:hypothetical protein